MAKFLLGVNYWPRRSGMYMWQRFDLGEIREDLSRMRELGLDVVRFFLLWEAFQPKRDEIDADALRRLSMVMDEIAAANLRAMPTLFCGHMSGVNWLPAWTLDSSTAHGRFRTIAQGRSSPYGIGDFYADADLLNAQELFARTAGQCVRDHPALYLWDLGNEFSNLREPAKPQDAAQWSVRLTEALIDASGVGATGGLHGEDLERDRHIRPSTIAQPWDYVTMHGYPVYATFSRGRRDTNVVPFSAQLAESFSGKRVLFSEYGNPTCPAGKANGKAGSFECLSEDEMTRYCYEVTQRLHRIGSLGAFWWCWADYASSIAHLPPFDRAPHELHFGIVRNDGSYKPLAQTLRGLAREHRQVVDPPPPLIDETAYYDSLPQGLHELYGTYCKTHR